MFFFFSSRRRHTRYWRDWSSDVCSSDLTTSYTGSGSEGCGVSMRRRSPTSSPLSRSTRHPLMPLPPMSTPKPCTGDRVVIRWLVASRTTAGSGSVTLPGSSALLALAVDVALEAADLIARGRATAAERVATKSSSIDVVTAVDTASEALIVRRLLEARPDDGLLGEEGAARPGRSGVRWVVDPIDGT